MWQAAQESLIGGGIGQLNGWVLLAISFPVVTRSISSLKLLQAAMPPGHARADQTSQVGRYITWLTQVTQSRPLHTTA